MSVDRAAALPSRPSPGAAGARLGELYAAHSRMVYGVCRMLLRDGDEAEDATQQVFLAAYRSLLTGTEVRDPGAWLGTIARNMCRRHASARMREPLAIDGLPPLVSPAADETAIGREESAALYAQVAGLPAKQREAVVLRDFYGLRYDEVAKALGTSRPAVEALLFRARRKLQHRLRPGFAAGVLAVPLAVQESIAYAVPNFAATAAPAGAAAAAAGIPLVAKLATAGAAVALAGSAGVVAERSLHDPPARPLDAETQQVGSADGPTASSGSEPAARAALLPVPRGGLHVARRTGEDDSSGSGEDEDEAKAAAHDEDDEREDPEEPDENRSDEDDGGGNGRDGEDSHEPEHEDIASGGGRPEAEDREDVEDESGPDHDEPQPEEPQPDESRPEEPQSGDHDSSSGGSGGGDEGDESHEGKDGS